MSMVSTFHTARSLSLGLHTSFSAMIKFKGSKGQRAKFDLYHFIVSVIAQEYGGKTNSRISHERRKQLNLAAKNVRDIKNIRHGAQEITST